MRKTQKCTIPKRITISLPVHTVSTLTTTH